jgi:addiction module HigA family antidote
MLMTKRKPATPGEILVEEFMQPIGLTQGALAKAMGVQRKHVNELCNDRRTVTAATALILARVFGNSPDFWLNVQRRSDLWKAMNSPRERTDRTGEAADGGGVKSGGAAYSWLQKARCCREAKRKFRKFI